MALLTLVLPSRMQKFSKETPNPMQYPDPKVSQLGKKKLEDIDEIMKSFEEIQAFDPYKFIGERHWQTWTDYHEQPMSVKKLQMQIRSCMFLPFLKRSENEKLVIEQQILNQVYPQILEYYYGQELQVTKIVRDPIKESYIPIEKVTIAKGDSKTNKIVEMGRITQDFVKLEAKNRIFVELSDGARFAVVLNDFN